VTTTEEQVFDMSRLRKALEAISAQLKELPSVHVTSAFFLREILETGMLEATPCDVFNDQRLVYLFYGKPAYSARDRDFQIPPGDWLYPSVIILKPNSLPPLTRVMPFDSGAFSSKRFKAHTDPMEMDDFELSDVQSAIRLVQTFFGSNENYLAGKPLKDLDLKLWELVAYYNLIRATGEKAFDERARTIELQVGVDVKLTKENVSALLLPASCQDHPDFDASVRALTADVEYYPAYADDLPPIAFQNQIYGLVRAHIKKNGWLA
jgi:hypothetical protein